MGKKSEVTFVSMSTEAKKTMAGLSKTALRASGKVVRKILRNNIPIRSKRFKNHIGTWAYIDRNTGQPQLQVGFYSWQRVKSKGKLPSHASPHWIESGTATHQINPKNASSMGYNGNFYGRLVQHPGQRGTNVLRNSVYDNIDEIRAAQTEYLKELNNTLEQAGVKVFEGEEDESD